MKLWSGFRIGIGSVACASVLVACADGRGAKGFKSYQYSAEELVQNKAKLDALKQTPPAPGEDDNKTPEELTSESPGDANAPTPASPEAVAQAPETVPDKPLFTPTNDAAQSKHFREVEQQVAAKAQDLNLTIDEELKRGVNQAALNLIKGITIVPADDGTQRVIAIQAVVAVGGEDLYFDASQVPVKYPSEGEQVPNMLFTLNKPCDQGVVLAKNSLWAAAKCSDEKCLQLEVVLSFELAGGTRANGVIIVELGKNAQDQNEWQITKSNIGTPKSFVAAQADGKACQGPAPEKSVTQEPAVAPVATPAVKTSVSADRGDSPGEIARMRAAQAKTTAVVKPEVSAADKRCQALKAKGLPCGEGVIETALMRKELAQAKAAAEEKRCAAVKAEGFDCNDSPSEIARMKAAAAKKPAAKR